MLAERSTPVPEPNLEAIFGEQQRRYRARPFPELAERLAHLVKLERAIRSRRGDLKAALFADLRKSADETDFTEYIVTLTELKFARKNLARWMKPEHVDTPLSLYGSKAEVRYEPKGVVLIMAPWNYPFFLCLAPLVAALAAGNRVILRPSEKAPATRDVIAAIVAEAFDPGDVAAVGGEVETAEALLKLPFDHMFYTGSPRVGKLVMKAAAEHLAGVTLELGGKSPAIVDAAADVTQAAARIVWGKFVNAGQTCVAPDYVLVHESVERAFIDGATASVAKMYGATDAERQRTPDYCRMIDAGQFERVSGLLDATVRGGARVETGGATDAAERYIAPTILSNVGFEAPIMGEEIFGPVLPVISYRSLQDALSEINARPKPLALYAFSRRDAAVEQILNGTSAGGTLVNDTILHLANPNLPFGGVGESGVGSYHGRFGFKALSHERAVMRQTRTSLAPLLAPPYTKITRAMLALLERLP